MSEEADLSNIVTDEQSQSRFVDQLLLRQDDVIDQLDNLNDRIEEMIRLFNAEREAVGGELEQPAAA